MIVYKRYNKEELLSLVEDQKFGIDEHIPISVHRAQSQCLNPNLDTGDTLLIAAYLNDTLVGYAGILPDKLLSEDTNLKMGWLSCLWVHETQRGKGIAQELITKAHESVKGYLLSSDYVPSTYSVYQKTKLFNEQPWIKKGIRHYVKSDLAFLLPPKHAIFLKFKGFLRVFDSFFNLFLGKKKHVNNSAYHLHFADSFNHAIDDISKNKKGFDISSARLNWIIESPWILNKNAQDEMDKKYYFTSSARFYKNFAFEIRNSENKTEGFGLFSVRDEHLKVPYLYLDGDIKQFIPLLRSFIAQNKINTFTCFQESINNQRISLGFAKKEILRKTMVSKKLGSTLQLSKLAPNDGDGDAAFT